MKELQVDRTFSCLQSCESPRHTGWTHWIPTTLQMWSHIYPTIAATNRWTRKESMLASVLGENVTHEVIHDVWTTAWKPESDKVCTVKRRKPTSTRRQHASWFMRVTRGRSPPCDPRPQLQGQLSAERLISLTKEDKASFVFICKFITHLWLKNIKSGTLRFPLDLWMRNITCHSSKQRKWQPSSLTLQVPGQWALRELKMESMSTTAASPNAAPWGDTGWGNTEYWP